MQNVIAVIWDFDKTLVNGYMQEPIFRKYGVDGHEFWNMINGLPEWYRVNQGVLVNKDTIYLNQFIKEARKGGRFEGLNNEALKEFGKELRFYNGVEELFRKTVGMLDGYDWCKEYGITVEHYIVSTGFAQVIRGSAIMKYVRDIWGCELIEKEVEGRKVISEVAYTIDNTTKTRALFEVSKGVVHDTITRGVDESGIDVNSKLTEEQHRVDFRNMIYIADGPSDVPAFSVVKSRGGSTFAIYPKGDKIALGQVEQLRMEGRVDMYAEADYGEESTANMWICNKIEELAERIKFSEKSKRNGIKSGTPNHLV